MTNSEGSGGNWIQHLYSEFHNFFYIKYYILYRQLSTCIKMFVKRTKMLYSDDVLQTNDATSGNTVKAIWIRKRSAILNLSFYQKRGFILLPFKRNKYEVNRIKDNLPNMDFEQSWQAVKHSFERSKANMWNDKTPNQ